MPEKHDYATFGVVTATVCVPFFVLIGSLNTTKGMHWWHEKSRKVFNSIGVFLAWLFGCGQKRKDDKEAGVDDDFDHNASTVHLSRTTSMQNPREMKIRRLGTMQNGSVPRQSTEIKTSRTMERTEKDAARPGATRSQTSRLAEMWVDEKRRTLKYSPHV